MLRDLTEPLAFGLAAAGLVVFDPRSKRSLLLSSVLFGLPAEAITHRKRDRMRRLAYRWLQEQPEWIGDVRFDVVSVIRPDRGAAIVEHMRAAF